MNTEEKGICRLSVVPVRRDPVDHAEMLTQLLFGEHYTVLERTADKLWIKVRQAFDQYEGWISARQHSDISDEYFEHLNNTEFKVCTDLVASILYKRRVIPVVLGSILPISSTELFAVDEHFAFNGESKNMGERHDFEFLKTIALKYLNSPYLWGGKSPFGIDCSGFIQQVFKVCGYRLKRDARDQVHQGEKIEKTEDAKPGDLAFFSNETGRITHVGMVLEEHKIIHASGWVRVDNLDEHGILNEISMTHTHRLAGLRRILK
jgi:hypothetical protein